MMEWCIMTAENERLKAEILDRVAEIGRLGPALAEARKDTERLTAENKRYLTALNWAMGCGDDFERPKHDAKSGTFWWRSMLAEKAGLTYDAESGRCVPGPTPTEPAP